MGDSP